MAVAFSITLYKTFWLIQVERSQSLDLGTDGFLSRGDNTAFFMELGIKAELNDGERFTALLIIGSKSSIQ